MSIARWQRLPQRHREEVLRGLAATIYAARRHAQNGALAPARATHLALADAFEAAREALAGSVGASANYLAPRRAIDEINELVDGALGLTRPAPNVLAEVAEAQVALACAHRKRGGVCPRCVTAARAALAQAALKLAGGGTG
jgi:hypothetical protein